MARLSQIRKHTVVFHSVTQKHSVTHKYNKVALAAIIAIRFLVLPASAGLHGTYREGERIVLQERAIPEMAGSYYRTPGKFVESEDENRWFGPEIDSRVLCPMTAHPFNAAGFFDIIYTREDAMVWPSSTPGKVWWYRKQEWRFATADTPWGTDTAQIVLVSEIGWTDIDAANSVTGFPWSGFEEHWREGNAIKSKAEIVGYYQYEHAGKKYLAPKYYKRGTFNYICATGQGQYNLKILSHTEGHFTHPIFRPKRKKFSRLEKGTDNWYDCIPVK